jgi:hypothetical protein
MPMTSAVTGIAKAFRMSEEAWRRHANPWSVYTRFAAIPPLIAAIWSRDWIGWWSLVPLGLVTGWLWLNPHVFSPIDTPVRWASKGIFGEQLWANPRDRVPRHHRVACRWIAIPGACGAALLIWGLIALLLWPTIVGATLVVLAQRWRIDRLVWMYEELHGTA